MPASLQPNLPPSGMLHPADEAEIVAIVRQARAAGRHIRVRGAGHAPAASFGRDDPEDLVLSLDRLRELTVLDAEERIVRVGAGMHLGTDPSAEDGSGGTPQTLLHQLADHHGWTVSSLGGITHQSLGGFLATCSAGGSAQHSLLDHVVGLRLVDGRGTIREFSESDEEGPGLDGVLPSLGLLGVITAVTLRCMPAFTIAGQEAIVDIAGAPFDLQGAGDAHRPSLQDFLTEAEYVKIEWWPQRGAERMLVWQAQQVPAQPGFRPTRYEEFTRYPALGEALFSTLFVIFGNHRAPARVRQLLERNATELRRVLGALAQERKLNRRQRLVRGLAPLTLRGLAASAPLLRLLGPLLEASVPWFAPAAMNAILPLDTHKPGMRRGEPQAFRDWAWEGLPMDNQADDVLLWTQFIELWVPLSRAAELVSVVRGYFAEAPTGRMAYERTGLYAYELYASPPATGWIHPAHSDGEDIWAGGALRLDIFWFEDNLEDPRERFFPQFWELLSRHGILFRSHWGKELPLVGAGEPDLARLAEAYPHWQDWLALRADCDPDGVFLTRYWQTRLGLSRP